MAATYSQLQLVVVVLVATSLMSCMYCCTATTYSSNSAFVMTTGTRCAIVTAINDCIAMIRGDDIIPPDYVESSYRDVAGSFRIRVTLTYCTVCMDRGNFPQRPIIGWDFRNRCISILNDMIRDRGRVYRNRPGFSQTSMRAIHESVRVQYSVRRIHDELMVISRRPSQGFISPTLPDLSKVKVIDAGPVTIHGSLDVSDVEDYSPEDCPMDASTLVGSSDIDTEALTTGEFLESPGHMFRLLMQVDCNLVLYSNSDSSIINFATGTNGLGQNCYTRMQPDCNLVVYDGNHMPLWASQTGYNDVYIGCLLALDDTGTITIWATYEKDNGENTGILWYNGIINN